MKKRDLEAELKKLGYWLIAGAKHDKWTNGIGTVTVPRHREINKFTAKGILEEAKKFQKKEGG